MISEPSVKTILADWVHVFLLVTLVAAICFALFGVVASLAVACLFYTTGPAADSALAPRFLAKSGVFALIAAGACVLAYRRRGRLPHLDAPAANLEPRSLSVALFAILLIASFAIFPRLGAYPWAAPDEVHHLVVARNLAAFGTYASGHPGYELRPFDTYDSVGPPVIVPVALSFRLFGITVATARMVMAIYFLLLCLAIVALLERHRESGVAALSVLFMTATFGSVYLGRTLYGEVPALFFLVAGLLCWRHALDGQAGFTLGVVAGIAFGLAILCKSILLLSAFAFLGALLYDLLTFRRIRPRHVLSPAVGLMLVLGAWWVVQTLSRHDVANAAGGTLGIYKHNLMFGLRSAPGALAKCMHDPLSTIPLILAMAAAVTGVFRRHYDPALAVLWFLGVFYAWWWVFFTPGAMARYLWFSAAIAAVFLPCVFDGIDKAIKQIPPRPGFFSSAAIAAALAGMFTVTIAAGLDMSRESWNVYAADEMGADYALADWVAAVPDETAIAATWPVSGTLNFLANKPVRVLEAIPEPIPANEVCIIDTMTWPGMLGGRQPDLRFGRYAVLAARE
jgi:4-amino-4-deoxy-L-arabinose transferase-like glycosyltransferase